MQQQRKLFGIPIFKKKDKVKSFAPPTSEDGSLTISPAVGASYGTYLDLSGKVKNEIDLITKYREMTLYPEVDSAIDDIVNEAIVYDDAEPIIDVNLDKISIIDEKKEKNNTKRISKYAIK